MKKKKYFIVVLKTSDKLGKIVKGKPKKKNNKSSRHFSPNNIYKIDSSHVSCPLFNTSNNSLYTHFNSKTLI